MLRGAAAGIIPYAINPLTSSVFPMKVYEYLAAGLPVVATPLPALDGVEDVVTAADAEAMAAALDAELGADTPELPRGALAPGREPLLGGAHRADRGGAAVSERAVLVTEHTPRLDSGHGLRRYAIARALASERPLDIVYTVFGATEPAPEFSGDERFRLHPVRAGRGARRLATYLRALAGGRAARASPAASRRS